MMNESFNSIRDTRQHAQVRHDLYEIIAMTIAAMIGNCDGWDEIEDFCQSKEMWLREHMGLELEHEYHRKQRLRESGDKLIQMHSGHASHNGRTVFMRN